MASLLSPLPGPSSLNHHTPCGEGTLGTTSYEQFFALHSVTSRDIMTMGYPLTPIPEGESVPDLPGKGAEENAVMLPKFLLALAQLPGAKSEYSNI